MVSEDVRDLIGRRRTLEVLELLIEHERLNYSDIESAIDSSSDTISNALKLLCKHNLAERREQSPRNVQYRPTETGREFIIAIEAAEDVLRD